MTEIIFIVVILILCGLIGWKEHESRLERNKLINALLAKNAQEMANLDLADKTVIKANVPEGKPDLVNVENLDNETFEKVM